MYVLYVVVVIEQSLCLLDTDLKWLIKAMAINTDKFSFKY